MTRFYRIMTGEKGGSGSFLCPPGHPRYTYSLYEYASPRHRVECGIGAIDNALTNKADASPELRARVQKIMDEAQLVPSELWIRSVYGYFRNCYAPEDGNRDVSTSIHHNRAEIAAGAARKALADEYARPGVLAGLVAAEENYRDGSKKMMRAARRGYEVTATADGSEVFVYTLADDGTTYGMLHVLQDHAATLEEAGFANVRIEDPQTRDGRFIPERVRATVPVKIEPIDPERHLAVLTVRDYFPDHEARLDLIDDPGKGYGSHSCAKCGEQVQYEGRLDKWAKVTARMDGEGMTHWTRDASCPRGGDHTVD